MTSLDAGSGTIATTGHIDPGATGTGRAASGDIRFGQATLRTLVGARNNANTADIAVAAIDTANTLHIGGTAAGDRATNTYLRAGSQILMLPGGSAVAQFDSTISRLGNNNSPVQIGLAGSTLTMDAAFRRAVHDVGLPIGVAVAAASTNPARVLGLADTSGAIAPGLDADLVLLDDALTVQQVYTSS